MQKIIKYILMILSIICSMPVFSQDKLNSHDSIDRRALNVLRSMSLKEKIGQKLMLDFRYWCSSKPSENQSCTQDFTTINSTIQNIISQNHIGGIILFSNNLKDVAQITTLTDAYQQTMVDSNNIPLLIGTDQEGGIVARLPRDVSVTFPGNMAITAAYLGQPLKSYSAKIGQVIATDLKAVGINVNFAPVVDVNVNAFNPVINVRSFSDDAELVSGLGLQLSKAIQTENVASTLKHFPGHGDTTTDSHIGLPVVNHTVDEAWQIDLYPFKKIIEQDSVDLIMTAHIQYPALDNSQIYASKKGEYIITPATLSRKIQYDLLRNQLKFKGIIITDALDMGAIAENFDSNDATLKAFQAGVDIALMPVSISQPDDIYKVEELITSIESAVNDGSLSEKEINESVMRIITLKIKLGLFNPDQTPLPQKIQRAENIISDQSQHDLEKDVTNDAITLVQNNNQLLPITQFSANTHIHILTPWLEQGAGIIVEIKKLQAENKLPLNIEVSYAKMANTTLENEKIAVDKADIVIVGNSTTKSLSITNPNLKSSAISFLEPNGTLVFPDIPIGDLENSSHNLLLTITKEFNESQFAYQILEYAKSKNKKTIFISLLAPYDLPNYKDVSDAMLAGYDYYGYLTTDGSNGYYRGPSMPALTRIIFGINHAHGKLPINIPNPILPNEMIYRRGYGLIT